MGHGRGEFNYVHVVLVDMGHGRPHVLQNMGHGRRMSCHVQPLRLAVILAVAPALTRTLDPRHYVHTRTLHCGRTRFVYRVHMHSSTSASIALAMRKHTNAHRGSRTRTVWLQSACCELHRDMQC